MAKYRTLVGMTYPPDRRAEAGDVVDDLPAKSIKWLREQNLIELADDSEAVTVDVEPVTEPDPDPVATEETVADADVAPVEETDTVAAPAAEDV